MPEPIGAQDADVIVEPDEAAASHIENVDLEEARRYRHRQWEKEHASEHRCGWSKESETNEPPPSRLSGLGGGRPVGVYLHGEFRGRAKRSGSRGPSGNQP